MLINLLFILCYVCDKHRLKRTSLVNYYQTSWEEVKWPIYVGNILL